MADSGPAWSSRSSSIAQGLPGRHPLTKEGTGRGAAAGGAAGRETDSKPGGSDGLTDDMTLLGGSSSAIASFRGGSTAAGAWIGGGAKTLFSWRLVVALVQMESLFTVFQRLVKQALGERTRPRVRHAELNHRRSDCVQRAESGVGVVAP
ncbi:hypothetical protein EYF80_021683 [Liparis tanakae]|uniref:Uncharacterized protein n=1 Tax=Liparis tanakae TaxID=230148 RepID=A0A4Z2HQL1_9TELE|nr:hypothetical protein EYF80_021683 [Liparis tanakae]